MDGPGDTAASQGTAGPAAGRRVEFWLVVLGAAIGAGLALSLDEAQLSLFAGGLGQRLFAPLMAAAEAGISCL